MAKKVVESHVSEDFAYHLVITPRPSVELHDVPLGAGLRLAEVEHMVGDISHDRPVVVISLECIELNREFE